METVVMLSNRHVHLSQDMVDKLFGEAGITFNKYLAGNGGPYSTNEFVDLMGPKGVIEHVRVLGPCRGYNQAEVLKSDCFKLGIQAPVRLSGDLEGAAPLEIIGPLGSAKLDCAILAHRHIHVGKEERAQYQLEVGQTVKVRTTGVRAVVFENVKIVNGGKGVLLHVDTEEGNAAGIQNGDTVEIIID